MKLQVSNYNKQMVRRKFQYLLVVIFKFIDRLLFVNALFVVFLIRQTIN